MDNFIGLTIGNFQIIELIGRGGMSSVYLAADKELERSVALKIPHIRFIETPDFVKRFRREAKAMARLRHPNIVQIYSVGTHGELPFFAMEYVQGESLAKMIKERGPIDTPVALRYITQIAHAIDYAHKMDVIHRDIKPANILVDSSDRVLMTDFGVSKLLSEETSQETLGFVGTPQYMSPEQCGQGVLDHRTDIYSLGTVLFEMLTGQTPFSSDSPAETIKKQLFDVPEFPGEFKTKIPERIRTIVCKMLAKDPDQRYPDISAFLRELENLDRECGEPTVAAPALSASRTNGSRSTQDFISHINGDRTRWPILVFASLLAVCVVAFFASFGLSNGADSRLAAIMNMFPGEQGSAGPGSDPAPQAVSETEQPSAKKNRSLPTAPTVSKPGTAHAITIEPEAEAAPEPTWTKFVIDSKPPGADVLLDSEPQGKTPLTLPQVTPGTYMLVMRLEGYPDHSEELSAAAAQSLNVFHDFVAAKTALISSASLSIDSEPSGAVVYINGENKGRTPLELSELRPADYILEFKLKGYETTQKHITLQPDETLRISLNLVEKPKFGDLSIMSQPDGAEVLLNGAYKGITPLVLRRFPVGTYEVLLQKEGYEPVKRELACKKNVIRSLEVNLNMTATFAALQSAHAGDDHMEIGDFASAIDAYDRARSLDPQVPAYLQKLGLARRSLLVNQVQDLLSAYEIAYEGENVALLGSLLDTADPDFVADQISNAERLFREFDHITITLSDAEINGDNPDEALVELHLSISAAFAETGVSVQLLDSDQTLTLRKKTEIGWKICAIQ